MQKLQGIAVSPGVAIGKAYVIDPEGFRIPRRSIDPTKVDGELIRLEQAIEDVSGELEKNRDKVSHQLGDQYGAIFAAHLQMLRDPHLNDELCKGVTELHRSPEWAVRCSFQKFAEVFRSIDDPYIAQRADDLHDLERTLLARLLGQSRELLPELTSPVVVLAHNLTPSETSRLDPNWVLGFATEMGGLGGHTAIVAEALEIPAVVGAGPLMADVSNGDTVIVDGNQGKIVLAPSDSCLSEYQQEVAEQAQQAQRLVGFKSEVAATADGTRIQLSANIEFPHEVDSCLDRGADGVGLYRTEFLYLGKQTEPTEDEHFQAYRRVVSAMDGRPVVIRTCDLGADKVGDHPEYESVERNPFLGLRSIRFSLRNIKQFRTQLRAIIRASALGKLRVMFPLIATLSELRRAKEIFSEVQDELASEQIEFDPDIKIGMMVEVPSAVVLLERFVKEVDFISIGTNDLVQYVLAVDRGNKEVADLYQAGDPAVLQMIQRTIRIANEAGVDVSLCGQMCGNPMYTVLLLGMGLRHMSVRPSALLPIKRTCRHLTIAQGQRVAGEALEKDSADDVDLLLRNELRKAMPDFSLL